MRAAQLQVRIIPVQLGYVGDAGAGGVLAAGAGGGYMRGLQGCGRAVRTSGNGTGCGASDVGLERRKWTPWWSPPAGHECYRHMHAKHLTGAPLG